MKRSITIISGVLCVFMPYAALALGMIGGCGLCTTTATPVNNSVGPCDKQSYVCANELKYNSCDICSAGAMRIEHKLANTNDCSYYSCRQGCEAGQYFSVSTCYDCPSPGTSTAGAVGITSCYIPANSMTFEDSTGY